MKIIQSTVLPLIIPAGIINFLPFFPAVIIRGRELLEVSNIHFHKKCIIEAFPDRFLIIFQFSLI